MNMGLFLVLLGVGGAAIAFWIDARYPKLGPREYQVAFLHVITAVFVATLVVPPALAVTRSLPSQQATVLAIVLIGLAALVYAFLAGVWIVRVTHGLIARHLN